MYHKWLVPFEDPPTHLSQSIKQKRQPNKTPSQMELEAGAVSNPREGKNQRLLAATYS